MADPTLNELRAFIAIAEHGSFRAAASELDLGPSALSRLIRSLERSLGVRLLHRTTRSVALTEAGAGLLERLAPAVQGVREALLALDTYRDEPRGTLRINAPEFAARVLMRRAIPLYLERHPLCSVDLHVENVTVDIVAERFDVGVRLGYTVPQDMIAVPFGGSAHFKPFASPGYIREHGAPEHPDDLRRHRCIRSRLPSGKPYRWEFARNGEEILVDVPAVLTLNHMMLLIEAGVAGLGVIYTLEAAARPYVDQGLLAAVLEDWTAPEEGMTLYYPGARHVPAFLRAFITVVREVFPR